MLYKTILNAAYYSGAQAVLKPMLGGIGSILMLHHVREQLSREFTPNDHLTVTPRFLDQMIGALSESYDFISMDEVAERLAGNNTAISGKPFLAITLDDGYRDNVEHAAPVFRKHKVPYTIYLAPGLVEGQSFLWWEDVENAVANSTELKVELPAGPQVYDLSSPEKKRDVYRKLMEYLFKEVDEQTQREIATQICKDHGVDCAQHVRNEVADWPELIELSSDPLCTLGAHTLSHYVLAKLDDETLRKEVGESKRIVSEKLDIPVEHFAYPYGYKAAAGRREFDIAAELGFKTAVTTRHGVLYDAHRDHMTALPRISVNGRFQAMKYMKTLLSGLPTRLKNRGSQLDVA